MTDKLEGLRKHNEQLNAFINECITNALFLLMKEKPYEKITVSELCKRAGVSRMAYYGNFTSKDDVIARAVGDFNKKLIAKFGSPFRPTTGYEWYLNIFKETKKNNEMFVLIFKAGFEYKYLSLVNGYVMHDKDAPPIKIYRRLSWTGGIINMIIHWIEGGMAESEEEMAELCAKNLTAWNE